MDKAEILTPVLTDCKPVETPVAPGSGGFEPVSNPEDVVRIRQMDAARGAQNLNDGFQIDGSDNNNNNNNNNNNAKPPQPDGKPSQGKPPSELPRDRAAGTPGDSGTKPPQPEIKPGQANPGFQPPLFRPSGGG